MQQNQPQPELSQDHIVRRLISKFRKPSDAGAIGLPAVSSSSSNLLQVPSQSISFGGGGGLPTISGQLTGEQQHGDSAGSPPQPPSQPSAAQRSLAAKQSRWSQLMASAAAGAQPKPAAQPAAPLSSTRSLLEIGVPSQHEHLEAAHESSSNRSSADGRDDEVDENYFRPGGKGHQALLDNMDKR